MTGGGPTRSATFNHGLTPPDLGLTPPDLGLTPPPDHGLTSPPVRPAAPGAVVLAAIALALHAMQPFAFFFTGANVIAGYPIPPGPVHAGVARLLADPTSAPALLLWQANAGEAAAAWVGCLMVVHLVLIVLVLQGTRTGRVAANVFGAATLLAPLPVLSGAILVLLNVPSARRFFRQAARWRRDPARTVELLPGWLPVSAVASLAVLVVAGWFATPNLLRLSGDAGIVRYFDGTAKVLVDPRALARGEVSGAVRKDVPVTAGRIVRVVATNGTVAQVRDTWVLKDGRADWTSISELDQHDGVELGHVETSYAIDRRSMAAAASYPAGWRVTQHRGLALDWPGGAAKKDYIGWVSDTRSTTTLRFAGQRQIEVCRYVSSSPVPCTKLDVLGYESTVEDTPIADERTLARLPTTVPPATVSALASALLPAEPKRRLDQMLATRTGPVPVEYTFEATGTYLVEPVSGIVVSAKREEIRTMHLRLPGQAGLPAIVISDVSLAMTCTRAACAGVDAWNAIDRKRLWGTTLPLVTAIIGVVVLTATTLPLLVRRRRRGHPR